MVAINQINGGSALSAGTLFLRLKEQIRKLEKRINKQHTIIVELESHIDPSIHDLEFAEQNRKDCEQSRCEALSDPELRVDLQHKYGVSAWSTKMINQILSKRIFDRGSE